MLRDLIGLLKTSIETIPNIQEVFSYPIQKENVKYPSIVFFPETIDNTFETTDENFKVYTFRMGVEVNIQGVTAKRVYEDILPQTFDDIVQHFDTNWNMATSGGHRTWARVSASSFGISEDTKGKTAFIDMVLEIKALTDN